MVEKLLINLTTFTIALMTLINPHIAIDLTLFTWNPVRADIWSRVRYTIQILVYVHLFHSSEKSLQYTYNEETRGMNWLLSSNRVDEPALSWSLYSPASWGIVTWSEASSGLAHFESGGWWRNRSLSPDSPENFWPQILGLRPAFHFYSSSRQGRT